MTVESNYPISQCLQDIKGDLNFYGGKSTLSTLGTFFFSIAFKNFFWYRISRYLFLKKNKSHFLKKFFLYRYGKLGGNEISDRAIIGKRVNLPHPYGIVIGADVIIEDDVTIFQQVTFGSHGRKNRPQEFPVVRSGAIIYSGAKIIGGITIGHNSVVGSNSVVLQDVPDNSMAAGVPASVRNG